MITETHTPEAAIDRAALPGSTVIVRQLKSQLDSLRSQRAELAGQLEQVEFAISRFQTAFDALDGTERPRSKTSKKSGGKAPSVGEVAAFVREVLADGNSLPRSELLRAVRVKVKNAGLAQFGLASRLDAAVTGDVVVRNPDQTFSLT